MSTISPAQIKAARAILNWSQEDLAQLSGLSVNTIRQMELGAIAPRSRTTMLIRKTIEEAGVEFLDSEGVRRRIDHLNVYKGANSYDLLFKDIVQTVSGHNTDVLIIAQSQATLAQSCGITGLHNRERATQLKALASVKCMIWENKECEMPLPFQFRTLPKQQIGPAGQFIYGDKHVLLHKKGLSDLLFIAFRCIATAQTYRTHFYSLWEIATPLT